MPKKYCFMNKERVCDLTCKAAFPVEDAVDPIDCYFIWLAATFGEGLFDLRKVMETMGTVGPPGAAPAPPKGDTGPAKN